ncbi:MAG: formate dehydrogenase accessory sulfurtransferase FdhD [Actinomycetota bacterium]|nr:formate dehydrogenase accessory sulfurtransferase FdhD [Actinomycetota bacterium]
MEDIIAFGRQIDIQKVKKDSRQNEIDYIPVEAALKIILNGRCLSPLPCSPFHTEELALGFLLNRAWLNRYSQIESVTVSGHDLDIRAEVRASYDGPGKSSAPFFSVPAGSLNRQPGYTAPLPFSGEVSSDVILNLSRQVLDRQKQKQQFGGLHSAALFFSKG